MASAFHYPKIPFSERLYLPINSDTRDSTVFRYLRTPLSKQLQLTINFNNRGFTVFGIYVTLFSHNAAFVFRLFHQHISIYLSLPYSQNNLFCCVNFRDRRRSYGIRKIIFSITKSRTRTCISASSAMGFPIRNFLQPLTIILTFSES